MSKGKTIALVAAGLFLIGGKSKAASAKTPDLPPPPKSDDDEPDQPIIVLPPAKVVTLGDVFADNVRPTPTPGFAYVVRKGDRALGSGGIADRALKSAGFANPTGAQRQVYYQAMTRVRSNWRLYGTMATGFDGQSERVSVMDTNGNSVNGTILAAFNKVNDNWQAATQAGQLPARLINWNRNKNTGNAVPIGGWQGKLHGGSRQYGVLMLPTMKCATEGVTVSHNPQCDWPTGLYTMAATTYGAWVP